MPFLAPDARIARHVEKLLGHAPEAKVHEVLNRCGLVREGSSIHSRMGFVNDQSCYEYKQALRDVLGETAYSFAKVNFVLAGCQCPDCQG